MIEVKYTGEYPSLCLGNLIVVIDGKEFDFGEGAIKSGGGICHDTEWNMWAEQGNWKWSYKYDKDEKFPEGFPIDMKDEVLNKINEEIRHGCCGGCIWNTENM